MRRLLHVAMTRARRRLVLAYPERTRPRRRAAAVAVRRGGARRGRRRLGGARGGAVRARRDAAVDVPAAARRAADDGRAGRRAARRAALRHRPRRLARRRPLPRAAQARGAARAHRPGGQAVGGGAAGGQRAAAAGGHAPSSARSSRPRALDDYLLDAERDERLRARAVAPRDEPSLEPFLPARGDGLVLSRLRHRDLPDLPAEVQVRARLPDPERADDQPALRDPRPPGARALPRRRGGAGRCPSCSACSRPAGGAAASATPRRSASCARKATSALAALPRALPDEDGEPVWFERSFSFRIGPHLLRGRVDRVDRLPDGGYELIDYKTGRPKTAAQLREDVQLSLYAVGAREAWQLEAAAAGLLLRARRREGAGRARRGRPRLDHRDRARGRRGHPRPGLRADAVATRRARCATTGSSARRPSAESARSLGARPAPALAQEALELAARGRRRSGRSLGSGSASSASAAARGARRRPGRRGRISTARRPGARSRSAASSSSEPSTVTPTSALELAQQRERGLRVRRGGDVVRDRGPQARGRQARVRAGGVQHADDPGRALVGRRRAGRGARSALRRRRRPVIETGRVCGTSASSAPSVTTICTPSASARSTPCAQNVRQRIDGSGPASRTRSRGARGHARLEDLDLGPVDLARARPRRAGRSGASAWKSKNSSGSIARSASASSCAPMNVSARGGRLAGVVPALERADQRRGPEAVGTALPEQRLHPNHRTRVRRVRRPAMIGAWPPSPTRRPVADAARRRRGRRRLRVHAQGPADRPLGHAVPGARAARPHRRDRRPARSATPTARRAASSAATSCASPGASSASATSCRSRCARSRAPRRPTRRRSCRSPTATSTSSTASSSTSRARSTTRVPRRCSSALLGDAALRAEWRRAPCTRAGHHAYLGGLLEHTVAVATLALEALPAAPAAELRPAAVRRARARPRQDARVHLRRRDRRSPRRAGCSATSCSGRGCSASARPAGPRAAAGARALRALPPRGRRGAGPALRLAGGAGALPPERARRERQGRARARPALTATNQSPSCRTSPPPSSSASALPRKRRL